MAFWRPRRRPDDLLRVVQRLEARVSGMERRILSLTERNETMSGDIERLQADEQSLQGAVTADNTAYAQLTAQVQQLQQQIAAGTDHAQLAALADQLETSISQLQSHGQPAPAPTPQPAQPQSTPFAGSGNVTTNPAVGGFVVPPAQETANPGVNQTPAQSPQPAPDQSAPAQGTETPAAPEQGQGPVGQAGT